MTGVGLRILLASIAVVALAQRPSPSPNPAPIGSPGTVGRPTTPGQGQQTPTDQGPFSPDTAQPIFLSGKVVLDDGGAPPEPVVIERVCNGSPRPEGYTDSKGRFSFQLGQQNGMTPDASVGSLSDGPFGSPGANGAQQRTGPGNLNNRRGIESLLMGCELRATLPGYRSEAVSLAGRRVFDNPDVGTIILHRLGNVEGSTISATSLMAPKDAKKAYEKGVADLKKNKAAEAQKELEKSVGLYPKYASAWFELGQAQEAQEHAEDARKSYAQALQSDAKFIKPYMALAAMSAKDKQWKDVAETTDRVIKLDPYDFPQAYFYNSVANYNLGNLDAAEKSAREAQKLDTGHRMPKVEHLLGVILADRRDYSGAAEQMRNYLKFAPGAQDAEQVRTQVSELEKLAAPKP